MKNARNINGKEQNKRSQAFGFLEAFARGENRVKGKQE